MIRALLNRRTNRHIAEVIRLRNEIEADIETARRRHRKVRHLYIAARELLKTQIELEKNLW